MPRMERMPSVPPSPKEDLESASAHDKEDFWESDVPFSSAPKHPLADSDIDWGRKKPRLELVPDAEDEESAPATTEDSAISTLEPPPFTEHSGPSSAQRLLEPTSEQEPSGVRLKQKVETPEPKMVAVDVSKERATLKRTKVLRRRKNKYLIQTPRWSPAEKRTGAPYTASVIDEIEEEAPPTTPEAPQAVTLEDLQPHKPGLLHRVAAMLLGKERATASPKSKRKVA